MRSAKYGLLLCFIVFFFACKKEKKDYTVRYRIQRTNSSTAPYTVRYTTADGTTKSIGSISGSQWNSGVLTDYKAKQYVTLTLEGTGGGTYQMYIYTSTAPYKMREADDNSGPQSIEMKIEE